MSRQRLGVAVQAAGEAVFLNAADFLMPPSGGNAVVAQPPLARFPIVLVLRRRPRSRSLIPQGVASVA
jgi:hypothetical protein